MRRLLGSFLVLLLLLAWGSVAGAAADPLASCQNAKLKAAANHAKKTAACFAKSVKKSDSFDRAGAPDLIGQCGDAQIAKLASSFAKAEAKATKKGADCSGAPPEDVAGVVEDALDEALTLALAGLTNPIDPAAIKTTNGLLSSQLKNTGNFGKKWVSAEGKAVSGKPEKRDSSRDKSRSKYSSGWDKANAKATKKGVELAFGAPRRPVEDTLQVAVDLILAVDQPEPLKDDSIEDLPVLSVDPPQPAGGSPATVVVDAAGATNILLTASGPGCGGFVSSSVAGALLELTETVGTFGVCTLEADVTLPGGSELHMTSFTVEPVAPPLPPIDLVGGIFVPGELPPPSGTPDQPDIAAIDAPGSLITGGFAQLRIQLQDPAAAERVNRVLLKLEGSDGYFEVPAFVAGDTVLAEVQLKPDFAPAPGEVLQVVILLVDLFGVVGDLFDIVFGTQQVGTGDVQVSLSWDTPTDVDLHVVEPGGEEIYFSHTSSATGGQLDLDSNAGCSIDGVNNENITWPMNMAPPGEYIVRVDFWSDCDTAGANYLVTTNVCGEVDTFTGGFAQGTSDAGGAGSGVEITRFEVDCVSRVRGKAVYEDRAQTSTGLAATTTQLPIRFADVEVQRASDGVVLARSDTKQDGTFDVRFANDGPAGYRVVVMAKQEKGVKQEVKSATGQIYAVQSDPIDETVEPDKVDLQIVAAQAEAGPAFNIFDVGVTGATLVRGAHGQVPPKVNWLWTRGQQGSCGSNVSCYQRSLSRISVLSIAADPDEYDDLVLLHEYGHFWQYLYTRSDSPGGSHSSRNQVDPQLAWGEGSATFFGNVAKGTSLYLDTIATGIGVRDDIESLSAGIPLGTSDSTQDGNLSEALVSAVLWDLTDSTNETKDTLASRNGVFSALAYLKSSKFSDRGTTGADLVDFLDGWFCRGNGNEGDANTGVRGNAIGLHQFNYDFATLPSCR